MKKKMMVLGGLLLAVVVTGYSVSGAYAKYTSSDVVSDSARVAKWSVGEVNDLTLFDPANGGVTTGSTDDLVAPGTRKYASFRIAAATTEVAHVKYSVKVIENDDTTLIAALNTGKTEGDAGYVKASKTITGADSYAPIKFALVNKTNNPTADLDTVTCDKTFAQLVTALEGITDTDEYAIVWEWPFEFDDATNIKDTALGEAMADELEKTTDKDVEKYTIRLTVQVTAEQDTATV